MLRRALADSRIVVPQSGAIRQSNFFNDSIQEQKTNNCFQQAFGLADKSKTPNFSLLLTTHYG
jgi:hypothetical protein